MNNIYIYKYSNGQQFQSGANPTVTKVWCEMRKEDIPKLIGVWRFKKIKLAPSDVSMFQS